MIKNTFYLILMVIIFNKCGNDEQMKVDVMSNNQKENLEIIQKYKIYFGHRSVGTNILKGLEHINSKIDNSKSNIIDVEEALKEADSFFSHSLIGENGKPKTKCDDFAEMINDKIGKTVDIALFKFCYADFTKTSNVKPEFDYYKKMYNELTKNHPDIKFIHVTVPLKSGSTGIKKFIKRLLNKDDWSDAGNIKRNEFNELLLQEYKQDEIFDLAKVQSTYQDGSRESFEKNGQTYYALISDFTTDGGHLNKKGGIFVAKELISFLSDYIKKRFES